MIPSASAAFETSPRTATALPPPAVMAETTASAPRFAGRIIHDDRSASAASDLAMAAPMPFDAPVTTATLPLSLFI